MKTILRSAAIAVLLSTGGASIGTAQAINACYVPAVGAVYLVGLTGLATTCVAPGHVAINLSSGGITLREGDVTTAHLADGAVTTAKIAAGTSVDLLGGIAASGFALASHTHSSSGIADGAITQTKLATNAVGSTNLQSGAVQNSHIAANAVAATQIAPGAVGTSELADGSVTAAKIASGISGLLATRIASGNLGGTIPGSSSFAYGCKTTPYTAGTGETALIWAHASAFVPVGQGLGIRPGANSGASDFTLGSWHYQENRGTASANLTNGQFGTLGLTPGATYVFSTAATNSESTTSYTAGSICNTMVVIVRIATGGFSAVNLAQ